MDSPPRETRIVDIKVGRYFMLLNDNSTYMKIGAGAGRNAVNLHTGYLVDIADDDVLQEVNIDIEIVP